MLNSLKEIHAYIMGDDYSNHPGQLSSAPSFVDLDVKNYNTIKSIVIREGFAIINCKERSLLFVMQMLKKLFGKPIKDVGMKKRYIATISAAKGGKFYANSAFAQPLHTDEGYRSEFPRFVSLYCVGASRSGGESIIVKVEALLVELYRLFGENVNNFFQSDFIQIESAYEQIYKKILFRLKEGMVGMSYSPILRSLKTSEQGNKMIAFINQFIHDPLNQYRVKLNKSDLLIMDNCRVLHGRTAFGENDDRLMLRLWNETMI
jgi:hypothetical protein